MIYKPLFTIHNKNNNSLIIYLSTTSPPLAMQTMVLQFFFFEVFYIAYLLLCCLLFYLGKLAHSISCDLPPFLFLFLLSPDTKTSKLCICPLKFECFDSYTKVHLQRRDIFFVHAWVMFHFATEQMTIQYFFGMQHVIHRYNHVSSYVFGSKENNSHAL